MKTKIILSTLAAIFALNVGYAQSAMSKKQSRLERIEVQKTAYISDKVGLTPEEAQLFWPLYNEFEAKTKALRKGNPNEDMPGMQRKADIASMSDKELKQLFEDRFNTEQKLLDLKREYHNKFVKVLGNQKTAKLYDTERLFKKELLKQLKQQSRM